ncbi:MAG: proline--tRNA ligase [Candidatus Dactylopiibacterium carminicum]|uniref:Proline--tRNA ligase n=1 Tax=Candidatus Dactylopiibacterium carminicum TaxID=857335 RepID=A0A272EPG8_9RHOO|nr:proline--tRNA ligase [Candidatus Dactylopiibacterium carminicum]KAF7598307.1 proline--tRNA ligase [Candidatus Dactylopiibacterium carminicum]PAS92025.1 MAG: proline--tRNA ligase [Candidatus Dactylopiibacterium carminicum]PAS97304.1 MAG: proline--tRNA ligase [Candidatus Dactylopiibacterium carminicum]
MRASQFYLSTLKEAPTDAEIVSHKLMMRAGMIKKLSAGIYNYMPMGLRVIRKIEAIVREEMNRAGAVELSMPIVQPAELWQETGRFDKMGDELLRFKDRHERDFVVQPTSEEVITDIVRQDVRSYRQLPRNLYQIQTKFRDERRPRFGIMRGREFTMKDAYSFHVSFEDLQREYRNMYDTYSRIFTRLGLQFRAVAADTGAIGGIGSHEFHVIAETGEDAIAYSPDSNFAANVELAEAVAPASPRPAPSAELTKVHTPGAKTIEQLATFLKIDARLTVKSVIVEGEDGKPVLLLLRGDHELNEIKAAKLPGVFSPLRFATPASIREAFGADPGSIGPIGFKGQIYMDRTVASMADFVIGANENDQHYTGANLGRDFPEPEAADIRNAVAGDASPDGKGVLAICRGIEVGHIFQLRKRYSEAMGCKFIGEDGKEQVMEMGCYGIGVTRIMGAAIEQNFDERGIIWPDAIAPFRMVICPMGWSRSEAVRDTATALYESLKSAGIDVILDDRDERPGVMFADWELIGVPHRVVIGDRGLKEGQIEYQGRRQSEATRLPAEGAAEALLALLK